MRRIDVCGNLGSGKTTMCGLLSERFRFTRVHAEIDESLLRAFLQEPVKWFLAEQTAFLTDKAEKLQRCAACNTDAAVDRSLFEDVEIFARFFAETYGVPQDVRAQYAQTALRLTERLPAADLAIVCKAPPDVCERRAAERGRAWERAYPPDHFRVMHALYEERIPRIPCRVLVSFDSEKHDLRNEETRTRVADDLAVLLQGADPTTLQTLTLVKTAR